MLQSDLNYAESEISFIGVGNQTVGRRPSYPGLSSEFSLRPDLCLARYKVRRKVSVMPRASGHSLTLRLILLGDSSATSSLAAESSIPTNLVCCGDLGYLATIGYLATQDPVAASPRVVHAQLVRPWLAPWPRRRCCGLIFGLPSFFRRKYFDQKYLRNSKWAKKGL